MRSFKRKRRHVPMINAASVADISFMLLILFLMVTSMDVDKGLSRQLPPPDPTQEEREESRVSERNLMRIAITADNRLTIDGKDVNQKDLRQRVMTFVENADDRSDLPEKHETDIPLLGKCRITDRHLIQIEADRASNYDTYFAVQNEIVAAYNTLRTRLAQRRFGRSYAQCSETQKEALRAYYKQRVSEVYQKEEGGEP